MAGSTIIVATDLSDTAECAAHWAHRYAEGRDISVVVSHVIRISVTNWAKGAYDVLEEPEMRKKAQERIERWYEEVTGVAPDEAEVRVGHSSVQLKDSVEEHDAAMLIASVSGKGSVKKALMGSTASNLASDPPCPVVLVEPEHRELHQPPKVAVGVDFSKNGELAAQFGASFARTIGGVLHLVHADSGPVITALEEETLPEEFTHDGLFEWAEAEMSSLVADLGDRLEGVDYETQVIEAPPAQGLLEFVRREDVDALIVGRSGHSPFVGAVMGSVLLKTLQATSTTTIIVPSDHQA